MLLAIAACTEQIAVGPEGKFSWEGGEPFIWPLRATIASPFGDSRRAGHQGIDLAARPGDAVIAAQAGRVAYAGVLPGYGTVVVLDHADHVSTVYAHLASTSLMDDRKVARGEPIGQLGAEGYLHYEVRRGKEAVDPMTLYGVAPQPIPGGSVDVSARLVEESAAPVPVDAAGREPTFVPPPVPERTPTPAATERTLREEPLAAGPTPRPYAPEEVPEPLATATPRATETPTLRPTATPRATATPTLQPIPTDTPRPTPTPKPKPTRKARGATPTPEPPPLAVSPTETPAPVPAGGENGLATGVQLFFINALYLPAKLAYSAVGGVTGGMALVLSQNADVSRGIWERTMGGDYFVTAAHLRHETELHFVGETSTP